jgi:tyrosyl-tRNA synthetase
MIDSKKLIEELKERGLMSSVSGDLYEVFSKPTTFYVGTDPTGDSLHVGHLLAFTTAKLLQSYGHRPIVLVGGFTAKIGDPSFRDTSRPLITDEQVLHNSECIKAQVSKLIDFTSDAENKALMLNNDEWMGKMSLSDYMKDVAKLTTVNYMMAKESVKKRLNREGEGISLCEFLYMTAQGYDFLHLYREYGCRAEIGGQDQYGNCTIGTEFIRKALGKTDVGVLTWPLVTRADGTKFGKSSNGKNIWLDPKKTSPFEFYQFWLNQSDTDAESFIKKFTLIPLDEIEKMITKHRENPSARYLQKELAKYMTIMVHSEEEYNKAMEATDILFGKGTTEQLATIDEKALLSAMDGVSKVEVSKDMFTNGANVIDLIAMHDKVTSKSEARKLIKANGVSINKERLQMRKM